VQLGRNRSRPRRIVRAWPAATRGTTHVHDAGAAHGHAAYGLGWCSVRGAGPARPRPGRRAWRAARACARDARRTAVQRAMHGARRCNARWRCSALAHGRWRGTTAYRRGVTTTGEQRARRPERHDGGPDDGAVGEAAVGARRGAVGKRAMRARRSERGGAEGGARGRRARGDGRCGAECGAAVGARRCPDSALSCAGGVARGGHAAAARCHVGLARRATADKRGPLSAIFELKIYPKGN
jgi:hypothetical protein